jgi:hypothetical protein
MLTGKVSETLGRQAALNHNGVCLFLRHGRKSGVEFLSAPRNVIGCVLIPERRAATSTCSRTNFANNASAAFVSTATRRIAGSISRNSSTHFPTNTADISDTPVMFSPGPAKLATMPVSTGSAAIIHRSKQHLYSITSSARASTVAGTSRPSAFAVLRLIAISYLIGACTGRSAGFSPLRMRST